jgi:hypothetical protein
MSRIEWTVGQSVEGRFNFTSDMHDISYPSEVFVRAQAFK